MSKHTPGKLIIELGSAKSASNGAFILKADRDEKLTSPTERDSNIEHAVDCWNACIGINPEAVPDLLAALQNLDREITALEMFGETGNTASAANVEAARVAARAAIAKATGN